MELDMAASNNESEGVAPTAEEEVYDQSVKDRHASETVIGIIDGRRDARRQDQHERRLSHAAAPSEDAEKLAVEIDRAYLEGRNNVLVNLASWSYRFSEDRATADLIHGLSEFPVTVNILRREWRASRATQGLTPDERAALEFYGDEGNYITEAYPPCGSGTTRTDADFGEMARKALASRGEE